MSLSRFLPSSPSFSLANLNEQRPTAAPALPGGTAEGHGGGCCSVSSSSPCRPCEQLPNPFPLPAATHPGQGSPQKAAVPAQTAAVHGKTSGTAPNRDTPSPGHHRHPSTGTPALRGDGRGAWGSWAVAEPHHSAVPWLNSTKPAASHRPDRGTRRCARDRGSGTGAHRMQQRHRAVAFSIPAPQPLAGSGLTLVATTPLFHFGVRAAVVSTGERNSVGLDE